jgi:N-hydroxyarylamine O-acetyltransferase
VTLDLDRYFERIGWSDPVPATFATLAGLLRAHMTTIPFENLDVLLGRPPSLEIDALQAKLIDARRGGYCYEHSTLFGAVLARLGFDVKAHSARVTVMTPKHASPRTHMLLSVELPEGGFVVDPGFGGLAPLVPVPFDGTEAGDHWLERDAGDWILKVRTPDRGVLDAWVTPMTPDFPIDFVMANHFTATHPSSPFTQRVMMRAFTVDGKLTIANRDVTEWVDGVPTTTQLADRAALHDLLVARFGFDLDVSSLCVPLIPEWT